MTSRHQGLTRLPAKILCVDDDADLLDTYQSALKAQFAIDVAQNADEGLRCLTMRGPYAVVISDLNMPGMDGLEFLSLIQRIAPDTVRIMLTSSTERNAASLAVNHATIFRFLPKPCSPNILAVALSEGIRHYQLIIAEHELLEKTLMGTISLLSDILSLNNEASYGQSESSQQLVRSLCRTLKVERIWEIEVAALLSHIGMSTVPPLVAAKAAAGRPLNAVESDIMTHVPEIGSMLISKIPRLEEVARIILYQYENFDGSGIPGDLSGTDIPIGSRIIRLLNDVQRDPAPTVLERCLAVTQRNPSIYDPAVVDAALVNFASGTEGMRPSLTRRQVRQIGFSELRAGQMLRSRIFIQDGTVVAAANQVVSSPLMERLCNYSKLGILVEPISVE